MMPCIAPIADAIGKLTGGDADERILEACFETFRKTFERVSESLTAGLRTKRTIGIRSVWIGTVGGFAKARYPYAPGEVTGRDAVKCFGGEEQSGTVRTKDGKGVRGLPKATRAARLLVAETAVRSASFEEAAETLRERGLDIGRSMVRLIALEAARRTQAAVRKDRPERRRPWRRWKPPYWAKRVTRTLVVMVDGKAFPCAKADLAGRKGRNGGSAKSRNANVICCGWFEWVDRKGRPIFAPHSIRYEVTGEGGAALGRTVWRVAVQEGVLDAKRVQFVSDGEEELEHVYQEHFKALPNCVRVLDAMHACGYVDTVAKALEPDGGKAARISRRLRRRLVKAGWKGCLSSLERIFGKDASSRLCGDARKAWNYLEKRSGMMDYGSYARRRLVIGSGMVEVGCKLTIGGRLAGPGMHWRFRNGVGIAELRAVMRSGLIIAV